ncbi:MAG: hypothetical protein FJX65_01845 [Alphaproteobacteria bacterium]|nr:hypothetical protein [Alphaproteobacteria bacterium]
MKLIDTGADATCIAAEIALCAALPLTGKGRIRDPGGTQDTNYCLGDVQVVLTGHHGTEATIPIRDLPLFEAFAAGSVFAKALLGRDVLGRGSLHIARDTFTFCL